MTIIVNEVESFHGFLSERSGNDRLIITNEATIYIIINPCKQIHIRFQLIPSVLIRGVEIVVFVRVCFLGLSFLTIEPNDWH